MTKNWDFNALKIPLKKCNNNLKKKIKKCSLKISLNLIIRAKKMFFTKVFCKRILINTKII